MSKLTMNDMNSLNAISGKLHKLGDHAAANVLFGIQIRATDMILQEQNYNLGMLIQNMQDAKDVINSNPTKRYALYVPQDFYPKLSQEFLDEYTSCNVRILPSPHLTKECLLVHI